MTAPVKLALALCVLSAVGCGGSYGRMNAAEKLPRNGGAGPAPETLKVQPVEAKEWDAAANSA